MSHYDTPIGRDAAAALYEDLMYEQLEVPCSSDRGFIIQQKLDEMEQEANQHSLTFDVRNSKVILLNA